MVRGWFLNLCFWEGKAVDCIFPLWVTLLFSSCPWHFFTLRGQVCRVLYQDKDGVFDRDLAV